MKKGKFVVLDGPEGSGKTGAKEAARKHFKKRRNLIFTREPGGTKAGELIREFLMSDESAGISAEQEIVLFCASRIIHLDQIIKPALENGISVICDRFATSTFAYEIYGRNRLDLLPFFQKMNALTIGDIRPDAIIILDVSPGVGLARREKSLEGKCTRFDKEALEYHERVRRGFLSQIDKLSSWHTINTDELSEQEVHKRVIQIITAVLK